MHLKKIFLFLVFCFYSMHSYAIFLQGLELLSPIAKVEKLLSKEEIIRLSRLSSKLNGPKKVGEELAKHSLSNEALEDAFMRIALEKKIINRSEAEGMYSRLSGVEGFRSTLRKVIGNSEVGTAGHLNELRIADSAAQYGFQVKGIGVPFDDGIKGGITDIDILLQKDKKYIAIEAKDYSPTTIMPMDKYRGDLNTLIAYKSANENVIPVFSFTNKPIDENALKMIQHEAKKRGVEVIIGSPQDQIEQIKILWRIYEN